MYLHWMRQIDWLQLIRCAGKWKQIPTGSNDIMDNFGAILGLVIFNDNFSSWKIYEYHDMTACSECRVQTHFFNTLPWLNSIKCAVILLVFPQTSVDSGSLRAKKAQNAQKKRRVGRIKNEIWNIPECSGGTWRGMGKIPIKSINSDSYPA
jgi:hypothetical protein